MCFPITNHLIHKAIAHATLKKEPAPDYTLLANISDRFVLANIHAVEDLISQLDLSKIDRCYSNRGSKHESVAVLLRISIYILLGGCPSPSDWARNVQTCNATRFVARRCMPSKSSLYRFRDKAKGFINGLFVQVLRLARKDGFLDGDEVAIDGTYIDALASRHRMVNHATLTKRIRVLEGEIAMSSDDVKATGETNHKQKMDSSYSFGQVGTTRPLQASPRGSREKTGEKQEKKTIRTTR